MFLIKNQDIMFTMISFFILLNVLDASQGVSWQLGLAIGSGSSYQIPAGYDPEDYSNYGAVSQIGTEVVHNYKRLKMIKKRLEDNEKSNFWVKVMGLCSMAVVTVVALLLRIRAVKQKVTGRIQSGNSVAIPMCHHSQLTGF